MNLLLDKNKMSLEEKITKGIVKYITSWNYNFVKNILEITFCNENNGIFEPFVCIFFYKLSKIELENFIIEDDQYIEQFFGIDERVLESEIEIVITTDIREIRFIISKDAYNIKYL